MRLFVNALMLLIWMIFTLALAFSFIGLVVIGMGEWMEIGERIAKNLTNE